MQKKFLFAGKEAAHLLPKGCKVLCLSNFMNAEKFSNALGKINDSYIAETIHYTPKRKSDWFKWSAAAAGLCFIVLAVSIRLRSDSTNENPITDNEASISETGSDLSTSSSADMLAFFIYQNQSYIYYTTVESSPNLVGDYLGTATGLIDEWSSKDSYVEFAGSISGDIYSVTGYDTDFLLCTVQDNTVSLYINDNGIALKTGKDLFDEKLHLADRYDTVEYQTRNDWYYETGNKKTFDSSSNKLLSLFISSLYDAPFMKISDIPLSEGQTNPYDDKEIYHLFFHMKDGIVVHLRLFEGGYVQFDGIRGVCVQPSEEYFEKLIDTMTSSDGEVILEDNG